MNVHVEYTDFKTFRNYFSVLHKKYSTSINGFTLYFDKKYSHKPFKFLRKKFGNLHFVIRATSLNKTLVDLCNRMRIELTVKITAPLSKGTRELMKNLHRAVVVYNQTDDVATQTFLTENEQFLVCTENENAAFHADLFHLALCRQTQYQCKCTSCLTSIVCVGKNGEVYFCPHHVQESMLGKIDDEGNYFENENFLRLLNEEIQKRNTCKSTCKYYPVCRGGCALENICETFKQEYPVCMESAKDTLTKKTPLNELPPYLTEAILKGVSHGNVKTLNE